jgi:dTDP-4-dehydrorhamnose 3,5-epimerase-like enzyme
MPEPIEIKQLREFRDSEGILFEVLRCDDSIFKGKFGQTLVSIVNPGIVKGLHLHEKQADYTTCAYGNLLYVAIDTRADPKHPDIKKVIMGDTNRVMIRTPAGVWHGYRSLDSSPAVVLHTMDVSYNPKEPDTQERHPFFFGNVWEL